MVTCVSMYEPAIYYTLTGILDSIGRQEQIAKSHLKTITMLLLWVDILTCLYNS